MKRTVLILLACLLLALPTVAQAPEKAVPDDLVITAEIVGYSKSVIEGKEHCMLYAKVMIRNATNHVRDISMMSCGWDESWLTSDARGFSETIFQVSCDKNTPTVVSIPVGESVIFNCPLILMNGYIAKPDDITRAQLFRLGFLDLTFEDIWNGFYAKPSEKRILEKIKKARAVYWSNTLTNAVDLAVIKEISGKEYPSYYLTNSSK